MREAEAVLQGQPPDAQTFAYAAARASEAVQPMEEKAEAAAYKRDVVRAVVRRALEAAENNR